MGIETRVAALEREVGTGACEHVWPRQHLVAWPGRPDELVGPDAPCAHVCRRCGALGEAPRIVVEYVEAAAPAAPASLEREEVVDA